MNEGRDFFTFFGSYFRSIDKLPSEMQVVLYRAICKYSLDFEEPDFSRHPDCNFIQAIWEGILPNLRNNNKQSINGKKGGAPKGNQNAKGKNNPNSTQKQPKNKQLENRNKKIELENRITCNAPAGKEGKKEFELSFVAPELKACFDEFLQMRKAIKKPLKTEKGIKARHKKLLSLSGGDINTAIAICKQSIEQEWQDFYELKDNGIYNQRTSGASEGGNRERTYETSL